MKYLIALGCIAYTVVCLAGPFAHIYTMSGCSNCQILKQELIAHHIPFKETRDSNKYRVAPVTEVNGAVIYGADIGGIIMAENGDV
jgi:hypothetical protein